MRTVGTVSAIQEVPGRRRGQVRHHSLVVVEPPPGVTVEGRIVARTKHRSKQLHRVGDVVEVLFDTARPEYGRVNLFADIWGPALGLTGFAAPHIALIVLFG